MFNVLDEFPIGREDDARFNYLREPTDASGDLLAHDLFRSTINRSVRIPIRRITRAKGETRWSRSHQRCSKFINNADPI